LIRTKRLGRGQEFLQESLLSGGEVAQQIYVDLLGSDWDQIAARFGSTRYKRVVEEGLRALESEGQLTVLEKLIDDFVMEQVKQAKGISLGSEPVIGYLMAKENEVRNIRIIMVGKLNGVPTDVIRERLRDSYV
jgi:V/A-type H+-transporting ATPase subunit C